MNYQPEPDLGIPTPHYCRVCGKGIEFEEGVMVSRCGHQIRYCELPQWIQDGINAGKLKLDPDLSRVQPLHEQAIAAVACALATYAVEQTVARLETNAALESLKAENDELKANLARNAETESSLARERLASANEADDLRRNAQALVDCVLKFPVGYANLIMRSEFALVRAAALIMPAKQ